MDDQDFWPITADDRRRLIETALEIAEESGSTRERLAAIRCVIAADTANRKSEANQDMVPMSRILELARELDAEVPA